MLCNLYSNKHFNLQSLLRLKEPSVLLRCRKADQDLVEDVLDAAKEEYARKVNVYPPEIFVDSQVYLPPAPMHHNAHGSFWYFILIHRIRCIQSITRGYITRNLYLVILLYELLVAYIKLMFESLGQCLFYENMTFVSSSNGLYGSYCALYELLVCIS